DRAGPWAPHPRNCGTNVGSSRATNEAAFRLPLPSTTSKNVKTTACPRKDCCSTNRKRSFNVVQRVVLSKSTAIFCTRGGEFSHLFGGTKRQDIRRGHNSRRRGSKGSQAYRWGEETNWQSRRHEGHETC